MSQFLPFVDVKDITSRCISMVSINTTFSQAEAKRMSDQTRQSQAKRDHNVLSIRVL